MLLDGAIIYGDSTPQTRNQQRFDNKFPTLFAREIALA